MNQTIRAACLAIGLLPVGIAVANAQPAGNDNPFAGFYLGGVIGYDDNHLDNDATLPSFGLASGRVGGMGGNGIAGGAIVGYNVALSPQWVAGLEGSFRYSDASGSTSTSGATGLSAIDTKARESWGLGGRLGFLPTRNLMVYASGGWTQGRFKTSVDNAAGINIFNDSSTQDAWRVGGGVEAALGGNWTARVDYTYANYSNYDVVLNSTNNIAVKPTSHQISLAVSRYF